jgi:acyl carrier protein
VSSSATGIERVVEFLRSRHPDLERIDPDLDLIDNRILDSLGFVSLLYTLEEITGQEISLEDVQPEDFRTLSAIEAKYLS